MAVIARHRPRISTIVDSALHAAQEQLREREPVPQVYQPSGTPLGPGTDDAPTTFKGRSAIFARLETLLGAAQRTTVILHGPRRSGKTSLLKQLPRRLGPTAVPVFVDLQGGLGAAERPAALLAGLAREIVRQGGARAALDGVPQPAAADLADDPYPAFARWLDDLEGALGERHVLLCLDEFEQLDEQIAAGRLDTRVLDLLRSIVQHRTRVTVVLTGVRTLAELPPRWAARLVSTTAIELGPLDRPDAEQLVTQPVPDFPPVYSPPAVGAILAATACEPFLLQVLCSVLVDELNAPPAWRPGDPILQPGDVRAALPLAADRASHYFLNLWEESVPDAARPFVRRLASPDSDPARRIPRAARDDDTLVEAVLALERRRIVTRQADGGHALTVPLFAQYVRAHQGIGT